MVAAGDQSKQILNDDEHELRMAALLMIFIIDRWMDGWMARERKHVIAWRAS